MTKPANPPRSTDRAAAGDDVLLLAFAAPAAGLGAWNWRRDFRGATDAGEGRHGREPREHQERLTVVRTTLRSRWTAAACVGVVALVLLSAWLMLTRQGDPTTAPTPTEPTPFAQPTDSPAPMREPGSVPVPVPLEPFFVPDPTTTCADSDDAQVYARPFASPDPGDAPQSSPRPVACPAL